MGKPTLHIIFEVLGVVLGIYLIVSGAYLVESLDKITRLFGWAYFVLGIVNIVVDTSFILSFIPAKKRSQIEPYIQEYQKSQLMTKLGSKVDSKKFLGNIEG